MQNSKIEWCDHTFNPWWGCQRVSTGCEHCYAETLANRYGHAVWGPAKTTGRRVMSENYWRQPLRWNEAARKVGQRARVFCASMADWLEDHPALIEPRARLIQLIHDTPYLDWLLLTKRPEGWGDRLHEVVRHTHDGADMLASKWLDGNAPENIWIGTSVENQEYADKRIPELLKVAAAVRFLSCEPLLGPVELWHFDEEDQALRGPGIIRSGGMTPSTPDSPPEGYDDSYSGIDWVIVGGESGAGARPMHPNWARSLRDQCQAAGVSYFFKQWGAWLPISDMSESEYDALYHPVPEDRPMARQRCKVASRAIRFDGGDDYRSIAGHCSYLTFNVGKKAAGRLLDGREWNQFPGESNENA